MSRFRKDSIIYKIYHPIIYKVMRCQELSKISNYKRSSFSNKLKTIKNNSHGDVCVLIGNGPSLKVEDLERLYDMGIPTFASNRIYGVYDSSRWRPTYYICQDDRVMEQIIDDMPFVTSQSEMNFLAINRLTYNNDILKNINVFPFFLKWHPRKEMDPEFSDDISQGICEGQTVIYSMAQIAVYMGYKLLYLIGVDNNYSISTRDKNSDKQDYFSGVKSIDNSRLYDAKPRESEVSFLKLLSLEKRYGFKVINCTRGGKLEVFKREPFDKVFKEETVI